MDQVRRAKANILGNSMGPSAKNRKWKEAKTMREAEQFRGLDWMFLLELRRTGQAGSIQVDFV